MVKPNHLILVLAALTLCACTPSKSPAPARQVVAWRVLGTWSGHGSSQTDSFSSETGGLRVRWETRNEQAGAGTFRLTLNSAISGRQIGVAIEHRGVGQGTGYVTDDPRVYYAVVESNNVDWTFSVEEGVAGTVGGP